MAWITTSFMDFKGFRAGNEHAAPAMENDENRVETADPFLLPYQPSELRIASEFLATWLPFLSRDLCHNCTQTLSDRVKSLARGLDKGGVESEPLDFELDDNGACSTCSSPNIAESQNISDNCDTNSLGSWKDAAEHNSPRSLKDELNGPTEAGPGASTSADLTSESPLVQTPIQRISWADMAQEDELEDDDDQHESNERIPDTTVSKGDLRSSNTLEKPNLSREQREYIRFINVKRTQDFICLEKINGKIFNILAGLELHAGVFSAAEQKRIVDYVHVLQEQGSKGELKERTYSAPQKWMRGKGRVTIQFGCCYNYAKDKYGNPPGILQNEMVDPIPPLLKVIIRRLIRWHILPPTCVPDSCIVNIYEEGDCIPPHIDNHDFVRPFCTVSFLSECNIVFGSNLKVVGAGEFTGSIAIPLPVGSVLVLNGNAADVAKHCVPAVPTKRISITFRRMDDSKRPVGFLPEPDLQGIEPLSYDRDKIKMLNCPISDYPIRRQPRRVGNSKARERDYSEPQYSTRSQRGPANKHKIRPSMGRGN